MIKPLENNTRVNVISEGLNMQCKKVIAKGVLVCQDGKYHLESYGIKIAVSENDLVDFMEDTKENRKKLKDSF